MTIPIPTLINNLNLVALSILYLLSGALCEFSTGNLDQFNYRKTVQNGNGINDFGPSDWQKIQCEDVDTCVSRGIVDTSFLTLVIIIPQVSSCLFHICTSSYFCLPKSSSDGLTRSKILRAGKLIVQIIVSGVPKIIVHVECTISLQSM
jgi:hypothetical protein